METSMIYESKCEFHQDLVRVFRLSYGIKWALKSCEAGKGIHA